MPTFQQWFLSFTFVSTAIVAGACAAGSETSGEGGDDGSGATGAATTTGGGGQGGAGGDGGTDLCGGMCDGIEPPDCQKAVCNDGSYPGTVGSCVVVAEDDGVACDDGQFCTTNDTCQNGACEGGPANDCGMSPPACQQITCDESSDSCSTAPSNNGDPCTDPNDLCLVNATCQNGTCGGGEQMDCFFAPVPDDCHVAVCNPQNGMCEPVPGNDGEACTDANDLCTVGKTCAAGLCQGGMPKNCSGLTNGCNVGICDTVTGNCTTMMAGEGMACDDVNACTTGEICTSGVCGGGNPVTTCSQVNDGCCPSNCDATNDIDCAFSCDLYSISSSRVIYTVDPNTAATTQVGTAGSAAGTTGALAQDPITKTVYLSSTGNDSLYLLDIPTGNVTLVGSYGNSSVVMHGLEWDSSTNTLYGFSSHDRGLYSISTATGTATLVGTTGLSSGFGSLGYDSINDVMYLVHGGDDSLYIINRATAAVTLVGAMGGGTSNPHALAFDPTINTMYLLDTGSDLLYTLNLSTGTATSVGNFGSINMLGLMCYSAP